MKNKMIFDLQKVSDKSVKFKGIHTLLRFSTFYHIMTKNLLFGFYVIHQQYVKQKEN